MVGSSSGPGNGVGTAFFCGFDTHLLVFFGTYLGILRMVDFVSKVSAFLSMFRFQHRAIHSS